MSMNAVTHFIADYGYWAMLIGSIIEGETILIAGGIAAKHGLLNVPGLVAMAVIGCLIHENICYACGRFGGDWLLNKRPNFAAKISGIRHMFDRYGLWIVAFSRFLYGFRILIPVTTGFCHMRFLLFFLVSTAGSLVWAVTFIMGGYIFGQVITFFLARINQYESWVFIIIGLLAVAAAIAGLIIWYWLRQRKRSLARNNQITAQIEHDDA